MKLDLQFRMAFILFLGFGISNAWSQVTTFDYTGSTQTYVVPGGVTSVEMDLYGAAGYGDLGLGGRCKAELAVSPGETLIINVGGSGGTGTGGFNGGGAAGGSASYGGGGGASDVRQGGAALGNRIIVAGGGGGSGSNCGLWTAEGGHGGGLIGESGCLYSCSDCQYTGGGGSQVSGGVAGPTAHGSCGGNNNGELGIGGSNNVGDYGTGGGGGYFGGGSGCFEGAGGGSSYTDIEAEAVFHEQGVRESNGQVIITILCNALTITASEESICIGQEVTLTAVSDVDGEITWEGDIENGVPFIPDELGIVEFTVSSDGDGDCAGAINVAVWNYPDVEIDYEGPDPICFGDEITLSGDGATDYEWELDVEDGEPFVPGVGVIDYTVIGTAGPGCQDIESITIEVFEAADISAFVTDDQACFGQSITLTGTGGETYMWSPDEIEDGVAFTPTDAGTYSYYVTGTDANGCTDQDSVEVFINEEIVITYATVEEILGGDGSIDITVTGGSPPYEFDWDDDGTGDWDDMEDLTDVVGGTHIVVVRDEITCTESETIELGSQVNISENLINVQVYPNPTSSNITIATNGSFNYELTTTSGALVLKGVATNAALIDLSELASGSYFITVNADDSLFTSKMIKK
ncbi:MAG: glycine-rich protein [Crocinitomix sp.]|nr:glycine-rich protein [Crocinitomix sp.]